jgi:hypothetical protein
VSPKEEPRLEVPHTLPPTATQNGATYPNLSLPKGVASVTSLVATPMRIDLWSHTHSKRQ